MEKCLISTIWETLKVIIRGNIIPHTSAAKTERERNGHLKSTILLGKAYPCRHNLERKTVHLENMLNVASLC